MRRWLARLLYRGDVAELAAVAADLDLSIAECSRLRDELDDSSIRADVLREKLAAAQATTAGYIAHVEAANKLGREVMQTLRENLAAPQKASDTLFAPPRPVVKTS